MGNEATNPTDWDNLDETSGATEDWPVQWGSVRKILLDLAGLWRARFDTPGDFEPADGLQYLAFGDNVIRKWQFRIGMFDADTLYFQENTGSDAAPVWNPTPFAKFDVPTGNLTIEGSITADSIAALSSLTLTGDLDLSGTGDIVNCGTITSGLINGVNVAAHAARHAQSGGDDLAVGAPVDIAGANAAGVATNYVRRDHAHRGVGSAIGGTRITVSGAYGAVTINHDAQSNQFTRNNGNMVYGANNNEQDITDLTGLAFPGAAVNAYYEISGCVKLELDFTASNNDFQAYLKWYVGVLGDKSDTKIDTWARGGQSHTGDYTTDIIIPPFVYQLTDDAHLHGLSIQMSQNGGGVMGAATDVVGVAGASSYLYLKKMPY
jgi:hypothetical protein